MRILTSSMQREIEKRAVNTMGISFLDLTHKAAESVFSVIQERKLDTARTVVLCGPGGNGGDGFALSLLLDSSGAEVNVILCSGLPKTEVPSALFRKAVSSRISVTSLEDHAPFFASLLESATLILDCAFGIGQTRELSPELRSVFRHANEAEAFRISVDVPSGICSDSGEVMEDAFHPDLTVALIGNKPSSVLKTSRDLLGEEITADLGLPESLFSDPSFPRSMSSPSLEALIPERGAASHKGTYGKLSIFAGCPHYRGAAAIAAKGAYTVGAGLVELVSHPVVLSSASVLVPEAIFLDTPPLTDIIPCTERSSAVLAGCGLEAGEETARITELLVKNCRNTLILDAGSLNAVAENPEILHARPGNTILTPHLGEFSRITGISVDNLRKDRIGQAVRFAQRYHVTLVLKSENTVVATENGTFWVDTGGSPGLAKAGSGDLLAGLISGLAATGLNPENAAVAGVMIHSAASLLTECDTGVYSMTATSVARHVPDVLSQLHSQRRTP